MSNPHPTTTPRAPSSSPRRAWKRTTISLLALAAAGCGLPQGYSESTFAGVTPDQVVAAFKTIATEEGYHIEGEQPQAGVVTTEWRQDMAMTWRDGTRRRVKLETKPVADGTAVSLQVPLEVNKEMRAPLNPEAADWSADGRSFDDEELLMMRLRMKLGLMGLD
jgi:hypothetical protein